MSYRISTPVGGFEIGPFVAAALDGLDREYPYVVIHLLRSEADLRLPRDLTPVFATNFDWHSSVHTHWALLRVARACPEWARAPELVDRVGARLTADGLARECRHLADNPAFERPYGRAWLALLAAEAWHWRERSPEWIERLLPSAQMNFEQLGRWIEGLSHPNRSGEHSQTAFAFGLLHDAAKVLGSVVPGADEFRARLRESGARLYLPDRGASFSFEPSGHDFLSPILAEADFVRRLLPTSEFAAWLGEFSGDFDPIDTRLVPVRASDPTDGKLAHLDGLNLSRAWMLSNIADALPEDDSRRAGLARCAEVHARAPAESLMHYSGGHWLGSFAIYLFTESAFVTIGASESRDAV